MAETCYRHPNRETRVSCSNCGRPICPDCMTPTPVGMRCPECASQRTKVVRGVGETSLLSSAPATFVLIAINAAVFLAEIASGSGGFYDIRGSSLVFDFGLFGPLVGEGEWYRLLTSGPKRPKSKTSELPLIVSPPLPVAISARKAAALIAIRTNVAGALESNDASPTPLTTLVRWLAHSGQRIPTGVGVMQSGQIGRPQLEHETPVSRLGCR